MGQLRDVAQRRAAISATFRLKAGWKDHRVHIRARFKKRDLPLFSLKDVHNGKTTHVWNKYATPLGAHDFRDLRRDLAKLDVDKETIDDTILALSHIMRIWRGQK